MLGKGRSALKARKSSRISMNRNSKRAIYRQRTSEAFTPLACVCLVYIGTTHGPWEPGYPDNGSSIAAYLLVVYRPDFRPVL